MIRLACDSDNLDALLPTPVIMTYSDLIPSAGAMAGLHERFPRSVILLIDRGLGDPTGRASIADVERGALTVTQLPAWWDQKHAAQIPFLTVYASLDRIPEVDDALGTGRNHWRWIASWQAGIGVPAYPSAMHQFVNGKLLSARVDLSAVLNENYCPQAIVPQVFTDDLAAISKDLGAISKAMESISSFVGAQ